MRKRTLKGIYDNTFWYILYALPVLAFLLYFLVGNSIGFTQFCNNFDFILSPANPVFSSLQNLFANGGILPLFASDTVFIFSTWFISIFLLHLAVDVILFIPRYAHKLMDDYFTKVD